MYLNKQLTGLTAIALTAFAFGQPALAAEKLAFDLEKKVGYAMNACAHPLRYVADGKNVAESVSMSDYSKFKSNYAEALAQKSDIDQYEGVVYGKKVSDVLPACVKLMKDYETGVGAKDLPVSSNCEKNVEARLKPILPGGAYHSRLSTVWFARKDLESARYRMYLHDDGFKSGGATCDANDQFKDAFAAIKQRFDEAEAQVKKWEAERGVEFYRVEDGDKVIFKKDGKVLTAAESNRV